MNYFIYDDKAINHLRAACPRLGEIIKDMGKINRPVEPDLFKSLVTGIISQQISVKSAQTVSQRLMNLVDAFTPEGLLAMSDEEIQQCGLSFKKVSYIKGICAAVVTKTLDLEGLRQLADEEVVAELVKLSGIGQWSGEMFLIFSLMRPDVVSYGDLVIRKAIMKLYGLDKLTKKEFKEYVKRYSPYGSVASLYLWAYGNGG